MAAFAPKPGEVVIARAESRLHGNIGSLCLTGQRLAWVPESKAQAMQEAGAVSIGADKTVGYFKD